MAGIPQGIPQPDMRTLVTLASIAVHADEWLSPGGRQEDADAIRGALEVPGVREYLNTLGTLALVPVMRGPGDGRDAVRDG